uniref:Pherophorin domain-containing protein n=1 Tax=Tetradesmus obliquus TaxID=3088 RepID=A0A383WDH9_TETOB
MRAVIFCAAFAVLLHCGQARHLLADEIVKCGSVTTVAGNCTGYTNVAAAGAEWSWDVTKDVWNNETDAVIQASCCVFKAELNTTCDALSTCEMDRVKLPAANTTSITGKLVSEAEPLCCEPAFTANNNCANSTVVCPVKFGAIAHVAGQLVNVSKTDLATQEEKCCAALPEYPVNATCADLNGPTENGTFLNCSDVSGYDFPFTTPAAARNGAPLDKIISGLNTIEALDECCMKVKYADGATCAANFNCTAMTPVAMAANTSNADVSLATVNIVDVEAAAALCCQPIVEDTVVPTTVAAWIADLEACKDAGGRQLQQLELFARMSYTLGPTHAPQLMQEL